MNAHKIIMWFCRLAVGLLFIFSGFIKANDPLGFSYKLEEYFHIFGMDFLNPASVAISIFICVIEIVLGVSIILGTFVFGTTTLLMLMIIFFTFLTGYSAITGAVSDCGCFGDAIKLTPTESFLKDVVLLLLIGYMYFYRHHINLLLSKTPSRIILAFSTLIITAFALYTYLYLPVIDFRPYKAENDIQQLMLVPEDAPRDVYEITLVYERDGQLYRFPVDDLPEDLDTYEWRDTENVLVMEGFKPSITDFAIHSLESENYTQIFFEEKGYRLMVVQYDLPNANINGQMQINRLIAQLKEQGQPLPVWGLTSSRQDHIATYVDRYNVPYQFYTSDATVLKTIVRSNPGLVLFHNNVIVAKWPARNIPNAQELQERMR